MLKILVVDDHAIVREGLKQILADNPDIVVSGEASNGGEALHRVSKNKYDLVLLDISMPDRSGLEVLRDLRSHRPKLPVMIRKNSTLCVRSKKVPLDILPKKARLRN